MGVVGPISVGRRSPSSVEEWVEDPEEFRGPIYLNFGFFFLRAIFLPVFELRALPSPLKFSQGPQGAAILVSGTKP